MIPRKGEFLAGLSDRLRTKTAGLHARLEALPFFLALHAGSLPRTAVVSFVRSLAIIHAVLERELAELPAGPVAALAGLTLPKLPLLVADLEASDGQSTPSVIAAIRATLDYGAEILAGADEPLTLLGILYVLEGSQNGGVLLQRAYSACLEPDDARLSYFGCYGRETAAHWKSFRGGLDGIGLDGEQIAIIIVAAERCFERLAAICEALYPYAQDGLRHHVTEINFEAGDHAMPQDPREIELALRAGRAAWRRYPYLEHRFGERGRRFTSSDSCWLVALTQMPVDTATRSLDWLRTVLASRGIPTVILEGHLRAIAQALAEEFPEQADQGARFDPFLAKLDGEYRAPGGADIARTVELFDRRFRDCAGLTVESAARLIASAWVDERSGIAGALVSVRDWFANAGRFQSDWIANVHALVAALDRIGGGPCRAAVPIAARDRQGSL
jgi:heme oxygenase